MPDFLADPTQETVPNGTDEKIVAHAPSSSGRADGASVPQALSEPSREDSPLVIAETAGMKNVVSPSERRSPPAVFTHYYGAFFLFLVGLFFGAGYLLLAPKYATITALAADLSVLNGSRNEERTYLDALNRSIAAAESIPKDVLDRIGEALPRDDSGIPKLLVTMSAIAQQSGVSLGSIQFSPETANPSAGVGAKFVLVPTQISTTVQANGYRAMRQYLANLEGSLRLIDVRSIMVNSSPASGEDGEESSETSYSYALQLTAYTIEKPSPPASPPPAPPVQMETAP